MTAEVISLGCRLNLSESEGIRTLLAGESDVVVINSCAVTSEAVRQTRQAIRRARENFPRARLLVTGCAADIEREQFSAMMEVDGLVANAGKLDPRSYNVAESASLRVDPGAHTRAFIAVQNGCDHACTFCVIPQGRGASRSLTVAQVLDEVARHCGAPEVVLTGVDVTSWGQDLPGQPPLGSLVRAILDRFPEIRRLRMSSLDGIEIDEELFELFASEPRMMPHLHLSLQHGDDLILKRMKRRHSSAEAADLIDRLKARRPAIAVGADLMAGFPTEEDGMHEASVTMIRDLAIVHAHIFPYSPRPNTPAARMPQLGKATIKARAAELRTESARTRDAWLQSLVGTPLSVLAESDGTGYSEEYARVALPEGTPRGAIVTITPTKLEKGLLL
ncbi:MAG: MiaB/RimO family radical SAM methylthiotransferase [Candidatus Andeanibacterium colombiense]|uniref:MiaB/RimO family radical SAM methylthiotransferase n=1 Tax=Candidatus Andeanibacterium colombiense TaxID=3121345 RepID=A0AAJ6BN60_9SPHN|nr:MAG: MiaB/RimO family radical SAM methylthiotransferase [Sphingomonadaceae bacterium]